MAWSWSFHPGTIPSRCWPCRRCWGCAAGRQYCAAEALQVTAATGLLIEQLFDRVPELKPFVRVAHGDGRVGVALVQSKPDYIFLTGSTATGNVVARNVATVADSAALSWAARMP